MAKKRLDLTDEDARSTPVGLFNFAETYWLSARALKAAEVKEVTHRAYPVFFLYYHAIELYLKAYLRLYHTMAQLRGRKFGHDAGALSKRARELDLPVKPKERNGLQPPKSAGSVNCRRRGYSLTRSRLIREALSSSLG